MKFYTYFLYPVLLLLFTENYANAADNDVCYAEPYAEDISEDRTCKGNSVGGINCRNVIPIINSSGEDLTDITVYVTSNGTMSGSFYDDCGVKDDEGECTNVSDNNLNNDLGSTTILGYSFTYDLNDSTPEDNQRDTYTESAVAIDFNDKTLKASYTKDGKDYYGEIYPCDEGGTTTAESGPFDAWDTFRDNNTTPPSDRNISTKILNKPFQLSLASLNQEANAYQNKDGNGTVDVAIYPNDTKTAISNHITFNPEENNHISVSDDFNVTEINKDATVGFVSCSTYYNGVYTIYDTDECSDSNIINNCTTETTANDPTWRICYSSDNFAIRPAAFRLFGLNAYKRAGEDFNLTIKTVDEGNLSITTGNVDNVTGTPTYNASLDNLNINASFYVPTDAEIAQMQTDTGEDNVTYCPSAGNFTFDDNNFTDGTVEGTFRFSETGILRVTIDEKIGSEFAKVDADDTNDSVRLIQPTDVINDITDINKTNILLFIPYKFETNATYETINDQNWTYISNEVNNSTYTTYTTPKQGAYIEYTITAKNKNGDILQNYTKTCFPDINETDAPRVNGLKLNTTFDLFLDATIESSKAANVSFYTQGADGFPVWTLNKTDDITEGNNTIQEWVDQWQFTNGVGKSKVYFSINRKTNVTSNPIVVTVHDANTSTSWMNNVGATNIFTPVQLDKNVTFYYGRTHVQRQRIIGQDGNVSINYEVYCSGTTCNKALLQDGLNSKTTDDPRWYINSKHRTIDGIPGTVNQKTYSAGNGYVTQTTAGTGNAPDHIGLHYNGDRGYTYKTTMENNASGWLIYNPYDANDNKNEFEVEFINGTHTWAGAHETNTSTKENATNQTNKRTLW